MKKRYSEEQIIGFLRDGEAGIAVKDLCRKHGFSEASYYLWKSKFGGMSVSDARRLKELEMKNARLKKLLAESVQRAERRGRHCDRMVTVSARRELVRFGQARELSGPMSCAFLIDQDTSADCRRRFGRTTGVRPAARR